MLNNTIIRGLHVILGILATNIIWALLTGKVEIELFRETDRLFVGSCLIGGVLIFMLVPVYIEKNISLLNVGEKITNSIKIAIQIITLGISGMAIYHLYILNREIKAIGKKVYDCGENIYKSTSLTIRKIFSEEEKEKWFEYIKENVDIPKDLWEKLKQDCDMSKIKSFEDAGHYIQNYIKDVHNPLVEYLKSINIKIAEVSKGSSLSEIGYYLLIAGAVAGSIYLAYIGYMKWQELWNAWTKPDLRFGNAVADTVKIIGEQMPITGNHLETAAELIAKETTATGMVTELLSKEPTKIMLTQDQIDLLKTGMRGIKATTEMQEREIATILQMFTHIEDYMKNTKDIIG